MTGYSSCSGMGYWWRWSKLAEGRVVIGVDAHREIGEGSDWGEFGGGLCEVEILKVMEKKPTTYVYDRVGFEPIGQDLIRLKEE